MQLIKQSFEILELPIFPLELIEKAGRVCYQSEAKSTQGLAVPFVQRLIKTGHTSVLEHANVTVKIVTNRGTTDEIVRHRHCSFSQESTRYVKYDGGMVFIKSLKRLPVRHYKYLRVQL